MSVRNNRLKCYTVAGAVASVLLAQGSAWGQQLGGVEPVGAVQLDCPAQPAGQAPGVYVTAIDKTVTLSKPGETLVLGPGGATSGFADANRLSCLERTPNFLEISPAPGNVGATTGCGAYIGSGGVVLPTGSGALQSDFKGLSFLALNEINYFIKSGYPAETVILHAVSQGMTVDKALYAAVNSDPTRANEFYYATLDMMPSLPGWVCPGSFDTAAYSPIYDVNDLPAQRTVREVANRYFKDNARMAPFPDWPNKEFNMLASLDELIELANQDFWYRSGPMRQGPGGHPADAVLVALYENGNKIVLDKTRDELIALKQSGMDRVPVTFFYNRSHQEPVSQLGGEANLQDVLQAFFGSGQELTQVPLWRAGDYHLMLKTAQLLDDFQVSAANEFDPALYQKAVAEVRADGFSKSPALITLLRSNSFKWLANPERIRAASELGITEVPAVLFYHRINRNSCGAPTSCINYINRALACANVGFALGGTAGVPLAGGGGGTALVPPPPPPPPPPLPPPAPPGYTPPPPPEKVSP